VGPAISDVGNHEPLKRKWIINRKWQAMKAFEQMANLKLLNKLIAQESTGTPEELAGRLKLSRRQVYNLIDLMKDWEAPIRYNKSRKTFYYACKFDLNIRVSVEVIKEDEQTVVYGGAVGKINFPCNLLARTEGTFGMLSGTFPWRQ